MLTAGTSSTPARTMAKRSTPIRDGATPTVVRRLPRPGCETAAPIMRAAAKVAAAARGASSAAGTTMSRRPMTDAVSTSMGTSMKIWPAAPMVPARRAASTMPPTAVPRAVRAITAWLLVTSPATQADSTHASHTVTATIVPMKVASRASSMAWIRRRSASRLTRPWHSRNAPPRSRMSSSSGRSSGSVDTTTPL